MINKDADKITLKERYELLIKARNFHYENFNKWMSYFYVMIASVIIAFSYIISKNFEYDKHYQTELIILGCVGFVISLLWHWANKGYYYWNINFITLVNYYEKELLKFDDDKRVYFMFANKDNQNRYFNPLGGANISTSKISILLSYLFALSFSYFVSYESLKECIICKPILITLCLLISIVLIFVLSGTIPKYLLYSHHDHFPDLKIDSKGKNKFEPEKPIKLS